MDHKTGGDGRCCARDSSGYPAKGGHVGGRGVAADSPAGAQMNYNHVGKL